MFFYHCKFGNTVYLKRNGIFSKTKFNLSTAQCNGKITQLKTKWYFFKNITRIKPNNGMKHLIILLL